jgi:hypothetical protein
VQGFKGARGFYHFSPLRTTRPNRAKGVAQENGIGLRCLKIEQRKRASLGNRGRLTARTGGLACDFPESAATWLDLGRKAGFSAARQVFSDPTGFYRVYRYDR